MKKIEVDEKARARDLSSRIKPLSKAGSLEMLYQPKTQDLALAAADFAAYPEISYVKCLLLQPRNEAQV